VAIREAHGQYDHTCRLPIHFTVVFSEPVTGFAADDITVALQDPFTGLPVDDTWQVTVTGGDQVYDVAVSGLTASRKVMVGLSVGAAQDLTGRPSLPPLVIDNTVTYKPWTNERKPADLEPKEGEPEDHRSPYVSLPDEYATALDVLLIINYINNHLGDTSLHDPSEVSAYVDANADGRITALDVLFVINYVNNHQSAAGEAESADAAALATPADLAREFFFSGNGLRDSLVGDSAKPAVRREAASADAVFAAWSDSPAVPDPSPLGSRIMAARGGKWARSQRAAIASRHALKDAGDGWLGHWDGDLSDLMRARLAVASPTPNEA
jgi:hypothetical protein